MKKDFQRISLNCIGPEVKSFRFSCARNYEKKCKLVFTLYLIVKWSKQKVYWAKSVPDRPSVQFSNVAFEAVSTPEQNFSALLLKVKGFILDRF